MDLINIGIVILLFTITWIVIACNTPSTPSFPPFKDLDELRCKPFSETTLEYRVANLLRENALLKTELEYVKISCRSHHQPSFIGCDHCCGAQVKYYAQTVEQQKMADMLAAAKSTTAKLLKDLTV